MIPESICRIFWEMKKTSIKILTDGDTINKGFSDTLLLKEDIFSVTSQNLRCLWHVILEGIL